MGRPHSLSLAFVFAAILAFAASGAAWAQQVTVFSEDFESTSGLSSANWPTVTGNYSGASGGTGYLAGTYSGGPDGFSSYFPSYALYFRSTSSTRNAITSTLDLSSYASVTISFSIRAEGNKGSSSFPFDGIDSNSEEIFLQYTTNASAATPTWVTTPLWRSDFKTTYSWATITVTLPTAALGSDVGFRWQQLNDESNIDNWAIDDIVVLASPEPGTWALFGAGTVGLAVVAARRRRHRKSLVAASATPSP